MLEIGSTLHNRERVGKHVGACYLSVLVCESADHYWSILLFFTYPGSIESGNFLHVALIDRHQFWLV